MKNAILFAAAIALIALLVACKDGDGGGTTPSADVTPGGTVSAQEDGTPSGDETPPLAETPAQTPTEEPEVCQPNPSPATPEDQVLDQPSEGDAVTSPVTISGQVRAFEANYQVRIFDAAGAPIDTDPLFGTAVGGGIGELAPFSIDVTFDVDEATPACIWVFELSARDGSQINIGQIPVILSP